MAGSTDVTITLVVPVCNVEKYLGECLDSVMKQMVPFDEVILVNDGSTDGSLAICERYASYCRYFKLVSQTNKGLSAARNVGMELAHGRYVMFLDSDDYLREDTVKVIKELLGKVQYDAVFFDADIRCEGKGFRMDRNIYDRSCLGLDHAEWDGREYFAKCYPLGYVVSVCMAAYRKETIDGAALMFPEGRYYEDNYFSFRFLNCAKIVVHISEKLYQRRYRDNSITSFFSEKHLMDYMEVCRLIWGEIRRESRCGRLRAKRPLAALVSDHCNMILRYRQKCVEKEILLGNETEILLKATVEDYFALLEELVPGFLTVRLTELDLSMLARLLDIFSGMSRLQLLPEMEPDIKIREIAEAQKAGYISLLKKLPLGEEGRNVGIYGTGRHTEGMLAVYRKLIGEIRCNLIFIDSRRDNEKYHGCQLIHYQKISSQPLDMVVISSFIYQQEMISNLNKVRIDVPIITFYDGMDWDVFSECEKFLRINI